MSELLYETRVSRVLPGPPGLVWALMADSNRWDRAIGFKRSTYSYDLVDPADPRSRAQIGRTRVMGMEVSWLEIGDGVEGRFLSAERRFLTGPVARGGYDYTVAAEGAGTRLEVRSYIERAPMMPPELAAALIEKTGQALVRHVDALARVLERGGATALAGSDEPPLRLARRFLWAAGADPGWNGPSSPIAEDTLAFCSSRFAEAPVLPRIRDQLLELLRTRSDDELTQLRPLELARAWHENEREVVRGFLYATRAGLTDLRWQLDCPVCRVGAEVAVSLDKLARRAHCSDCDIAFELDLAANVEATFSINPALRKVKDGIFCASSPWHRPQLFAGLRLEPGQLRALTTRLPAGGLLVRVGQRRAVLPADPPPRSVEVRIEDGGVIVARGPGASEDGSTEVSCENGSAVPLTLLFERADYPSDAVPGTMLATFPEFIDLFSAEAPAVGLDLTVGNLSVLFSDLTGTTSLYRRIGDARAFALIQAHFQEVTAVIAAHEGAVVKTMGDAVMATFTSPAHALAAGLEMARRVGKAAEARGVPGLAVRVGIHEGACLAVRANGRLDFFGTTVNLAARLQAQAGDNEVAMLNTTADRPDVARVAAAEGVPASAFAKRLKGFDDPHEIVTLRPR